MYSVYEDHLNKVFIYANKSPNFIVFKVNLRRIYIYDGQGETIRMSWANLN